MPSLTALNNVTPASKSFPGNGSDAENEYSSYHAKPIVSPTTVPSSLGLILPLLPANKDPASVDIPFRGKLVATYTFIAVWMTTMTMICVQANFEYAAWKINPMLGPGVDELVLAGAMVDNYNGRGVVEGGEWWRVLWSSQMHAGWFHLLMNVVSFWKLGEMVEPDWGFWKTTFVFISAAITGSLLSTAIDGNKVSVGASGGLFGLMAGLNIYIIEYWPSIPKAKFILMISIAMLALSIGTSFIPYVDAYAHVGGAIGGLLASGASIMGFGKAVPESLTVEPAKVRIVDPSQQKPKMRFIKQENAILADVPSMAYPALVKTVNPSARRWSLRTVSLLQVPLNYLSGSDKYDISLNAWSVRVICGLALVALWTGLIYVKFSMKVPLFSLRTTSATTRVLKELAHSRSSEFLTRLL